MSSSLRFGGLQGLFLGIALIFILVLSPALGSISSIVAVLSAIVLSGLAIRADELRWLARQPVVVSFVAAFLLITAAFAATARGPGDVLFNAAYLALLPAGGIFLVVSRRGGIEAATQIAVLCFAGAALGLFISCYQMFLADWERAAPFVGGPNLLPRIALPLGFVAAAGAFLVTSRWRYLFFLAPLMSMATTLLSGSRGAALAIPAMALCLLVALFADRRDRRLAVAITVGAIVAGGLFAIFGGERFATIVSIFEKIVLSPSHDDGSSGQVRVSLMVAGYRAFLVSPWVGHGWPYLAAAARPYYTSELALILFEAPFFQFHNDFVNFAASAGIPGILAALAILFGPVADPKAWQADALRRPRLYGLAVLIVGNIIFGQTDLTLGYDVTLTLHAFLAVLVLGTFRSGPTLAPPGQSR